MIEDCSIFLIKTALDLYIFEAELGQRVDLVQNGHLTESERSTTTKT